MSNNQSEVPQIISLNPGFAPLVMALCRLFKIESTVNSFVEWDEAKSRVSPGIKVLALIVNILCHRRPLSLVEKFYQYQDMELLFNGEVTAEQLNDDALGQCLEKLAEADQHNFLTQVSLRALSLHDLDIFHIHEDTTSISVEGEFDNLPFKDFEILRGNSKDKRPDLKQFMIGLATQQNGLPVWGEPLKGNTSDKKWNPKTVAFLNELFDQKGYRDIIFVADSALVNTEDLNRFRDPNNFIKVISLMPNTYSVVKEVKDLAFKQDNWEDIGALSEKKDAALYRLCSFRRQIGNYQYRLLVAHSSTLDKRKLNKLNNQMQKTKASLEKQAEELARESFYCAADANKALEKLMAVPETKYYPVSGKVEDVITLKYPHRGRPKKGEEPIQVVTYRVVPHIGDLNQQAFDELKQREATFVLVTNILDEKALSNKELLVTYKNQNNVELVNRLLKDPAYLGPVWLKNQKRIKGLACVFILAIIVATYLQYRVRKALEENGQEFPLGDKTTKRPTFQTIKQYFMLGGIPVFKLLEGKKAIRFLPANVDKTMEQIVHWIGFTTEIFTSPKHLALIEEHG